MKCLLLAAGYATRLYPLTENFPKPLLKVKDKTILDWLIDDVENSHLVDEYIVISNHKFANNFISWAKDKKIKITVIDDKTNTNETRLGAVKDINYAIKKLDIDDDLLVLAGDNVLDFSLTKFINYAVNKKTSCVMRYFEEDEKKLQKCGVLTLADDLILQMQEKPAHPQSHWCCPPFYYYLKEDIKLIDDAINDGCATDAPGSLISWLCQKKKVHAFIMPGKRYDIGSLESYNKIKNEYKGIK